MYDLHNLDQMLEDVLAGEEWRGVIQVCGPPGGIVLGLRGCVCSGLSKARQHVWLSRQAGHVLLCVEMPRLQPGCKTSPCMHTFYLVCVCSHTCIHTFMAHVHSHKHAHAHMQACIHTRLYGCTPARMQSRPCTHTHTHTHARTHARTHTHTRACRRTRTRTCAYAKPHTSTHIHECAYFSARAGACIFAPLPGC